jgi:glycine cleavage system transcriptional repressor
MPRKFLLTAFSKDRPGIVADLAQVIYENGCSLEDSAMANLAGEFAMMFLFSPLSVGGETDLETALTAECRRLEREKGITAFIRPVDPADHSLSGGAAPWTIKVEGQDQAGIVYKVCRFLADNQINIRTLNSEVVLSPQSGAALYRMTLTANIAAGKVLDEVTAGLNRIGEQLHVDISID